MSYNTRYRHRKQKKANKVLNAAIAIVVLLIIFISGKLILGNPPVEEASITQEEGEATNEGNNETTEETATATENEESTQESEVEVEDTETQDSITPTQEEKEKQEVKEDDQEIAPSREANTNGPWEPIGTTQEEPFTAVYDRDHQNWEEMTKAIRYATGLDDSMIIWYLGNGGNHKSAVGTVSDPENKDQPYEVRLEWVEGKGWKPVSVQQLEENKYN